MYLVKKGILFIAVLEKVINTISRNLFILAHQVGDRNFYPEYKRLVQTQWKSYEEF